MENSNSDSTYSYSYANNKKGGEGAKVTRVKQPHPVRNAVLVAAALLLLIVLSASVVETGENEFTLIKRFGGVERVITTPGLSFKIPFIETATTLDKEVLLYDLKASDVITLDKKTMVADSFVLWRITDPKLYVQTLNSRAEAESRLNTIVYNSLKNVISSMNQNDVISGRDGALDAAIMDNIGDALARYGIELLSVETKHLDLPDDNKNAVYERMISERNNIAATYTAEGASEAKKIRNATDNEITILLSRAKAEAEKTIAAGEAEYMRILAEAYATNERSDFYTFVRSLDAARAMMQGGNKTLILSSDSPIAQIFRSIE
ncbi:MAG: protease modulator HflC [Lachnospiraceae bacterium]|nr:protease modulator HflC [Lachnospiraceae bacterium]